MPTGTTHAPCHIWTTTLTLWKLLLSWCFHYRESADLPCLMLQECVGQRSHTSTQKQYAPQVGKPAESTVSEIHRPEEMSFPVWHSQQDIGVRSSSAKIATCTQQVGSIQGFPFVMGMSGSTVGVPAGAKCTSPPKATSGGLAQTSSARSAPAALLRSLSIGRSLEGIVGGLELHTPQRASRHRTK